MQILKRISADYELLYFFKSCVAVFFVPVPWYSCFVVEFRYSETASSTFTVNTTYLGKVVSDSYNNGSEKARVMDQLEEEYNILFYQKIFSEKLPYEFAEWKARFEGLKESEIGTKPIEQYNVNELGNTNGVIYLEVVNEEYTDGRAAEILKWLGTRAADTGIRFRQIELVMHQKKDSIDTKKVIRVLYTDLFDDNLVEKIRKQFPE